MRRPSSIKKFSGNPAESGLERGQFVLAKRRAHIKDNAAVIGVVR
jgi:hypothetical protein